MLSKKACLSMPFVHLSDFFQKRDSEMVMHPLSDLCKPPYLREFNGQKKPVTWPRSQITVSLALNNNQLHKI